MLSHSAVRLKAYGNVEILCKKTRQAEKACRNVEVPPGFEPGNKGVADLCLTTWLWHRENTKDALSRLLYMERKTRFELATFTLAR